MTLWADLFGTEQEPVPSTSFTVGSDNGRQVSFTYENGSLRHIQLNGIEAIRGISFLVRDRDWGTLAPKITQQNVQQDADAVRLSYHAVYESDNAVLAVDIVISASPDGLTMTAKGHAEGAFETNRAGFTVLHPIRDVAGAPVRVQHSDGTVRESEFPALIAPWQPFMDITALTHQVGSFAVECQFQGDSFEMEDQRQWGDASFKTYNRPLAKPWPYEIEDGAALEQSVTLSWTPCKAPAIKRPERLSQPASLPQMALVIDPQDARRLASSPSDLTVVNPQRLLCHLDTSRGGTADQFAAFGLAQKACPDVLYDLELICQCATDPTPELMALAQEMRAADFTPDSVLICPSVDRQSTPPGSDWPECPPLDLIHSAAAQAFPNVRRGGGMVSFFPELNRKRPPVERLDFVSHGLCPIVHAADDLSVMETLEAIPHITQSMRAIIGDRPYRIGPATLAMRQNPYGTRTIPNPNSERVCMADDDPRHRAKFGAAYVMGLAAALAPAGIEVWTPAALYGPRGVITDGDHWPISGALKHLAAVAGQPVHASSLNNGLAQLHVGKVVITANLTAQPHTDLAPYGWRLTTAEN